ncbi:mitochondrial 37S ribosomal protein mS38 [Drepanopeziza brunnea f. sp. 'multigermtubi']|uniref:Small ribosomal subunit protein mS38 n=1 Tax=Marssonina brunnea f. sp. multigermtubi (strain MB_m1) TaxID=1072389 RepID=K1XZW8_MARBU|nr:DUF1713 domain protein [Drepanopeziza brunnea f. sp. 'multigermtubi' MB_m1]EKD18414.1 DUF1713 domain protein [Drepanopeziza brunnea f. sp. 'multigermtubi' MB_m1]KAJ5037384.1 hypothetical protein L3040_007560 [Drepanopeziza brunnea f. sp. 'multigermtubi']
MFSSSLRRVARAVSQPPTASFLPSSAAPPAVSSHILSYHSRRHSSSNPSRPADGSSGINEIAAAPAKSKRSKKVAKDVAKDATVKGRDEAYAHLPSVPSTHHIAPMQISASAFFALHRPMSLTQSIPRIVTDAAFASIFTAKTKANKSSQFIPLISEDHDNYHNLAMSSRGIGEVKIEVHEEKWNQETDDVRAGITPESYRQLSAETTNLDPTAEDSSVNFPKHLLVGRYKPFHPPAPPTPQNTPESLAAGAEAAQEIQAELPQPRIYTAMLTIEESTDANGDVTYMAHSSPLIEDAPKAGPQKFLERMKQRQEQYRIQRSEETDMLAISVKRQRKLKMKKHKYKKLMRRTRNLRRRLDRN